MPNLKDTFFNKETSLLNERKKRDERRRAQSEGGEEGADEEDFDVKVEKVVMKCDDAFKLIRHGTRFMVGTRNQYIYVQIENDDGWEFIDPRQIADGSKVEDTFEDAATTVLAVKNRDTSVAGLMEKLAINGEDTSDTGSTILVTNQQTSVPRFNENRKIRSRSMSPTKFVMSEGEGVDYVARRIVW